MARKTDFEKVFRDAQFACGGDALGLTEAGRKEVYPKTSPGQVGQCAN